MMEVEVQDSAGASAKLPSSSFQHSAAFSVTWDSGALLWGSGRLCSALSHSHVLTLLSLTGNDKRQ